MMKKYILSLLLLLTLGASTVFAEVSTVENVANPKVTDARCNIANPDGVLKPEVQAEAQAMCDQMMKVAGVEVCVVALEDIGDADSFDFAFNLFQEWGVGDKKRRTGVLLLLTVKQRDLRIITGGGIEGVMPDVLCHRMVRKAAEAIKKGDDDYGAGILSVVKDMHELVCNENLREELWSEHHEEDEDILPWVLGFFLLCFVSIGAAVYFSRKKCSNCGKRSMKLVERLTLIEPTRWQSGVEFRRYVCQSCGNEIEEEATIPYQDPDDDYRRGGGGFIVGGGSGFGGGGFSGGSFGGGSSFGGGAGTKF